MSPFAANLGVALMFLDPYYSKHEFTNDIRIFLQKGVGIKSQYLRAVREFYQSQVDEIDFGASGSGNIRRKINSWMKETSGGNFEELLQKDPDVDTRLVLASYTSMKPRWLYPFDPKKTSYNGLFFLPGGERLQVAMMSGQFQVPVGYSEQLTSRLLELPLLERRMSMFLILPDTVEPGIATLESTITTHFVKELRATLKTEVVNVRLPKFKIEKTVEFVNVLDDLGVSQVLDPTQADLENMVDKNILHLSSFKHRAEIEITEGGNPDEEIKTEATSVGILRQKFFEVDHPFVYFIWDYYTGTILLIGRVIQPITV